MNKKLLVKLVLFLGGVGLIVGSFITNRGDVKQNFIIGSILCALALPIFIDMLNSRTQVGEKEIIQRPSRIEKKKTKLLKELQALDKDSEEGKLMEDIGEHAEQKVEDELMKTLVEEEKEEQQETEKEVEPEPKEKEEVKEEPKPSNKKVFICPTCKKKFVGDKAEMKMKRHFGMAHWKDMKV